MTTFIGWWRARSRSATRLSCKAAGVIAVLLWLPVEGFRIRDARACLRLSRRVAATPVLGQMVRRHAGHLQVTNDEAGFFLTRQILVRLLGQNIPMAMSAADEDPVRDMQTHQRSIVIASPHYLYFPFIHLHLERLAHRKIAVVAMHPDQIMHQFRQHFPAFRDGRMNDRNFRIIPSDSSCLAKIREILDDGWIIVCQVDSPRSGGAIYDTVRPGIFRLAELTHTPVYAARYTLTDEARLEIGLKILPMEARAAAEGFAMHQLPERTFMIDPALTVRQAL